ncbi:hypothetical protein GN156_12015 [bacterium LRH843]|nr:hypothetical protein [bacterium LRH843]
MNIISLSQSQWEKYRRPLLRFIKRFDKSANTTTYNWLFQLKGHHLNQPGTSIQLVIWNGKIIAVAAVCDFGTTHSLILLEPKYQKTHIKVTLLTLLIQELGVCYTKIRYDNEDDIKSSLQAGLVCFAYIKGIDDLMYLWFGGGHWHANDVIEHEA